MTCDRRELRLAALAVLLSVGAAGCGSGWTDSNGGAMLSWGGDVLGGGPSVAVSDSVAGDVIIAGGDLSFSGVAGGDYVGAGGNHDIGGRIAGNVRAAGGALTLSGEVGKNITVAGGHIETGETAVVRGNAYLAGQSLRVAGTIDGFVRANGSEVVIDGTIAGSVDVRGGSLHVGPGARITGDLSYSVPAGNVTIDPGAQIGGEVIERAVRRAPSTGIFRFVLMLGFLVAGGVAVAFFPRVAMAAERSLRDHPAATLGYGLVWVIMVPIVIMAIMLTGVGIPLALIVAALYMISLYLGRAVAAVWLGRLLLRGRERPGRSGTVMTFLIGAVILLLLGRIPFVGGIVSIIATVFGLGALVVVFREVRQHDGVNSGTGQASAL